MVYLMFPSALFPAPRVVLLVAPLRISPVVPLLPEVPAVAPILEPILVSVLALVLAQALVAAANPVVAPVLTLLVAEVPDVAPVVGDVCCQQVLRLIL